MFKRIFNVIFNSLPLLIWLGWFFISLYDVEHNIDLGTIQIILLLCLPIMYSVYNTVFSYDKKNFLILNTLFGATQVFGYYMAGSLYYNYISSDSETALIVNAFSGISIVYILIATLIFYKIRAIVDSVRNK